MIHRPQSDRPEEERRPTARLLAGAAQRPVDLYRQLYRHESGSAAPAVVSAAPADPTAEEKADRSSAPATAAVPAPAAPQSLQAAGLNLVQICDLILKQLYVQGSLLGLEIARNARLPFTVIQEWLQFLKDERCVEISSGEVVGPVSYRFHLTELGRTRARDAFEQCRYVGPAPVSLDAYVRQCALQMVSNAPCAEGALRQALGGLVLRPGLLDELGTAVCSGKSIFLHGPPGNGKTMVAKALGRLLNQWGGDIYVPYALQTENSVVTIFDPTIHQPTDHDESRAGEMGHVWAGSHGATLAEETPDLRWRRIRRPVVITAGELTLSMLDLRYNPTSKFYQAPLHIKANGGVFLVDDFGRQIVSPRELLNRWILPLEERVDYLTLVTGKSFAVPFEQLTVISTNLDPRDLVDEAFLRRMRHKISIESPSREIYGEILRSVCEARQISFSPEVLDFLFSKYEAFGRVPRSSDPRDLLEMIAAICRFRNQEVRLSAELLEEAVKRLFCQF